MATTLDEQFLQDLEELSEGEGEDKEAPAEGDEGENAMEIDARVKPEEPEDVAKLAQSERFKRAVANVDWELSKDDQPASRSAILEDDPAYQLIVECNQLVVDIDNELGEIHNFIKDKYKHKFPELESLVLQPVDYARVVKRIGNEMDLTQVQLDDILPSATVMVVTVTGSTTGGQPLSEADLEKCSRACDLALELDEARTKLLKFIEARMWAIAPNLCELVGSEISAKMMATAGGLQSLAKMPGCNVQVLGSKKKHLAGFSAHGAAKSGDLHAGFLWNAPIIQRETPPELRKKAQRVLGSKMALIARKDAFGEDPSGQAGKQVLDEVRKKVEKWQEPAPAKIVKPMKKPEDNSRKRRGGRRLRKMKEKFEMTEMRKQANRVGFNQPQEDFTQDEIGEGMGQLASSGGAGGAIRAAPKKSKTLQKAAKQAQQRHGSAAQHGTASSLAFTPVQGIELANPSQQVRPSLFFRFFKMRGTIDA